MSDGNRRDDRSERRDRDERDNRAERDSRDGRDNRDGRGDWGEGDEQDQEVSTAEKVLMVISVGVTLLLFGYVAWQATEPPNKSLPEANVVGTETAANGSVIVHVKLTNPGDRGLISATVKANCAQPPPDVTFDYIPADGTERGVLVCPAGTSQPSVSVSSWVPT